MKHTFIVISSAFASQYDGYKSGCNTLRIAITKDGTKVTSANALNEFPELFAGRSQVSILQLTSNDFPEQTSN